MIYIDLGNIGSKEQAERIQKAVEGTSYFDFKVEFNSYMGNWPVIVSTEYEGTEENKAETEKEAKDMLMFILACEV